MTSASPRMTDRAALIEAIEAGFRPKFLLFWGHTGDPAQPGPHTLSQWWPAPFTIDGITYQTAEHFMMAQKARLFADHDALAQVISAKSPGAAKAAGRAVRNFDEALWSEHRFDIVVAANSAKFAQHPALAAYLRETGDKVLVEASPVDRIWGIGLARDHADATKPERWKGLNLLGFALMQVRAALTPSSAA